MLARRIVWSEIALKVSLEQLLGLIQIAFLLDIHPGAREFHTRLTDGSIASQRPDGAEIVAAMKRARAAPDGTVRWTETCYCPTPLEHERATVLDRYFTRIETRVIDKPETFDGMPLMDRLAAR